MLSKNPHHKTKMFRFHLPSFLPGVFGLVCLTFVILCEPVVVRAQNTALSAIAEELKQAKKQRRSQNAVTPNTHNPPALPPNAHVTNAYAPASYGPRERMPSESRIRNPFDEADNQHGGATDPHVDQYGIQNDWDVAAPHESTHFSQAAIPRILREQRADARIYDVCFVTPQIGWAVGDRGTIWKTSDAGENWTLQNSFVDCSLRGVSFIDANRGIAVGGFFVPFSNRSEGVILQTNDGGENWERVPCPLAPMLHRVKMENRSHAWVAGEVSPMSPGGIFRTSDGGRNWLPLAHLPSDGWKDFRFLDPQTGAGVTINGELYSLRGNLQRSAFPTLGFPLLDATRIAAIELFLNQNTPGNGVAGGVAPNGWVAGKEGMLYASRDYGNTWQNVPVTLPGRAAPEQAAKVFDFQTVFARENNVWVAGKPGTFVFHSQDAGQTWKAATTGVTVPIHAIRFCDPMNGFAAGDLGTIIATKDGGQTWTVQRQGGTRLAFLGLFSKPEDVPLELIAQYSNESGYLSAVEILSTSANISETSPVDNGNRSVSKIENLVHESIVRSGGCSGSLFWGFSLAPDEWKMSINQVVQRFDGDAPAPGPGPAPGHGLVRFRRHVIRSIRMWKPNIIVVSDSRCDDPVYRFLARELSEAIPAAADPNVFPEQIHEAALEPWKVSKLMMASREFQGEIHHNASDYAFRTGRSLEELTFEPRGLIQPLPSQWFSSVGVQAMLEENESGRNFATKNDMFAGITIAPGTEARRIPLENAAEQVEHNRGRAQRRAQIIELGMKMFHEQNRSEIHPLTVNMTNSSLDTMSVIGELSNGFDEKTSIEVLLELGLRAQQRHHWDVAEAVYLRMFEQFPYHPYTAVALKWLIQYNASKEVFWSAQRKVELAVHEGDAFIPSQNEAAILADRKRRESLRYESTRHCAQLMKVYHPEAFTSPQIAFALAASQHEYGSFEDAEKTLAAFLDQNKSDLWKTRAQFQAAYLQARRLQLEMTPMEILAQYRMPLKNGTNFFVVKHAENHPYLDGLFDDESDQQAWNTSTLISFTPKNADRHNSGGSAGNDITLASAQFSVPAPPNGNLWNEKPLAAGAQQQSRMKNDAVSLGTQAMFMYDDDFLYVALRCRKSGAFTYRPVDQAPRPRDPDLSNEDRVEILLDTNLDYGVTYKILIDHRGWIGDECWGNRTWNPALFAAREEDEHYWTIEVAIPWEQLTDRRPGAGTVWGIALRRIVPGVGEERWNSVNDQPGTLINSPGHRKTEPETNSHPDIGMLFFE